MGETTLGVTEVAVLRAMFRAPFRLSAKDPKRIDLAKLADLTLPQVARATALLRVRGLVEMDGSRSTARYRLTNRGVEVACNLGGSDAT